MPRKCTVYKCKCLRGHAPGEGACWWPACAFSCRACPDARRARVHTRTRLHREHTAWCMHTSFIVNAPMPPSERSFALQPVMPFDECTTRSEALTSCPNSSDSAAAAAATSTPPPPPPRASAADSAAAAGSADGSAAADSAAAGTAAAGTAAVGSAAVTTAAVAAVAAAADLGRAFGARCWVGARCAHGGAPDEGAGVGGLAGRR